MACRLAWVVRLTLGIGGRQHVGTEGMQQLQGSGGGLSKQDHVDALQRWHEDTLASLGESNKKANSTGYGT